MVAAAEPANRSRTIAIATTATAALPSPWIDAADGEQLDGRGEGTEDRGGDVQRQSGDQRAAAADGVRERADEQLAEAHAEQDAGQGALHGRLRRGEVAGDGRQRRQVGVDGQRADGDQRAEHEDEAHVGAPRRVPAACGDVRRWRRDSRGAGGSLRRGVSEGLGGGSHVAQRQRARDPFHPVPFVLNTRRHNVTVPAGRGQLSPCRSAPRRPRTPRPLPDPPGRWRPGRCRSAGPGRTRA